MLARKVGEDGKVWYVVEGSTPLQNKRRNEDEQAVEFLELEGGELQQVAGTEENGVDNDSDFEEVPAGEQSTSTAQPAKKKRVKATGRWSNDAIWKLLDVIEKNPADLEQLPYQGRIDYWAKIAAEIAPHPHTGNECCFKFKSMKMSYRKMKQIHSVTDKPVQWPFFNRVAQLLGDDDAIGIPTIPPLPADHPSANDAKFAKLKTKPVRKDEAGLTIFEELLKRKKDTLDEVKHHGVVLKKHIEETTAASARREKREIDMLDVLRKMRDQEEKKLELFQKLLDKLW